jgi:acetylglutamate kinase
MPAHSSPPSPSAARPGPMVVKIGGAALEDPASQSALWHALASAHRLSPGGVVLVHGGGSAIDAHLARLGMQTRRRDGIRLTPPEQMLEIAGVLAGRLNKVLVGALLGAGALAVGLAIGDGFLLRCAKTSRYGPDAGQVGEVHGGEGGPARALLGAGYLPVISSIGIDTRGELLNVNADDAASGVAQALHASMLVLLTDVPGVLDGARRVVARLDAHTIDRMIASGEISGGMIPKVRGALEAARASGAAAVIAPWGDPSCLEALARGDARGTRIEAVASHAEKAHA